MLGRASIIAKPGKCLAVLKLRGTVIKGFNTPNSPFF
jgi:hypothetical protein